MARTKIKMTNPNLIEDTDPSDDFDPSRPDQAMGINEYLGKDNSTPPPAEDSPAPKKNKKTKPAATKSAAAKSSKPTPAQDDEIEAEVAKVAKHVSGVLRKSLQSVKQNQELQALSTMNRLMRASSLREDQHDEAIQQAIANNEELERQNKVLEDKVEEQQEQIKRLEKALRDARREQDLTYAAAQRNAIPETPPGEHPSHGVKRSRYGWKSVPSAPPTPPQMLEDEDDDDKLYAQSSDEEEEEEQ
jgi:hypothetical protein